MTKNDDQIIEKAIAVISRYGIKKTTMADLAEAVGVSRQTLYNKYPNKEEVLRAAVRYASKAGLHAMQTAWANCETLDDKLEAFFVAGPISWYDAIIAAPDSADLIDGVNVAASEEMVEGTKLWLAALASLFAPYRAKLEGHGFDEQQLADFLYASSTSAKYNAATRDQLLQRLAVVKASVGALVQ